MKHSHKMNRGGEVKIDALFIEMICKIGEHFEGDYKKARLWLITPNLNFGGIAPLKLYTMGKVEKVLQFIENARKAD